MPEKYTYFKYYRTVGLLTGVKWKLRVLTLRKGDKLNRNSFEK